MSEMVERAERVVHDAMANAAKGAFAEIYKPGASVGLGPESLTWGEVLKFNRDDCAEGPNGDWAYHAVDVWRRQVRASARAVLTAIREPSEEMIRAGEAWQMHCSDLDSLFDEMIKAALWPEDVP